MSPGCWDGKDVGSLNEQSKVLAPLAPPVSYAERAYRALREAILRLDLQPGQSVSENELAVQLEISRSPLRQAFALLQKEGLIITFPQKGSYVTRIDPKEVADSCEMRLLLETWSLDKTLENGGTWDLQGLRQLLQAQEEAVRSDAYATFLDLDSRFHMTIMGATGNDKAGDLYEQVNVGIARVRAWELRTQKSLQTGLTEHREIFRALEAEDVLRVKELCVEAANRLLPSMQLMRSTHPAYFTDHASAPRQ